MNLKTLLLLTLIPALDLEAQCTKTISLVATTGDTSARSISVDKGTVAKIVSLVFRGSSIGTALTINFGTKAYSFTYVPGSELTLPLVIAGPATIKVDCIASSQMFCTVELDTPCASLVPSNAVVIPADSGGPVNIILESSTDLLTWTAALPGTYGTSTTNRFFRVRAQRTQ